jgi:hypothetical protein
MKGVLHLLKKARIALATVERTVDRMIYVGWRATDIGANNLFIHILCSDQRFPICFRKNPRDSSGFTKFHQAQFDPNHGGNSTNLFLRVPNRPLASIASTG